MPCSPLGSGWKPLEEDFLHLWSPTAELSHCFLLCVLLALTQDVAASAFCGTRSRKERDETKMTDGKTVENGP